MTRRPKPAAPPVAYEVRWLPVVSPEHDTTPALADWLRELMQRRSRG